MQRRHRTAHVRIWTVLAVILPLAFVVGLLLRQQGAGERPAVQLEAAP